MAFFDRDADLAVLRDHATRPGASLLVLYGRRRIGKTALLQQAFEGHPGLAYHVATRSTLVEELARLSQTLAAAWDLPLLSTQPLLSTAALLNVLESVRERRMLILDEFPYLVESDPSLPGKLQASWDRVLSRGPLKLVLCGSSVAMMEETLLSPRSPLFGRRTGQLRLGPLPPGELRHAFRWATAELVELAACFGGVPGYFVRLDPGVDLATNLARTTLTRGEPLYEEVPFLLREELREPRVYHAILAANAGGAHKLGELGSKVGLDRANLTRYLATLQELGLLAREVPITDPTPHKSRRGLYRIADPFVATWFRFVHPYRDLLERGLVDVVMKQHVRPQLGAYLGTAVEAVWIDLFRAAPRLAELVPFTVAHAGRHWSPTAELDVVLLDAARGRAFVGEVKWQKEPVGREALDHLRARVAGEPVFAGVDVTYGLVSRAGFTGRRALREDERLIDVRKVEL